MLNGSNAVTVTVNARPAVTLAGAVTVNLLAAAGLTMIELDCALTRPVAVKERMIVSALSSVMFVNEAIPPLTVTVVVPSSGPLPTRSEAVTCVVLSLFLIGLLGWAALRPPAQVAAHEQLRRLAEPARFEDPGLQIELGVQGSRLNTSLVDDTQNGSCVGGGSGCVSSLGCRRPRR